MAHDTLYRDSLVTITEGGICFHTYYFPIGAKCIPFADMERITTAPPTLLNGRYRLWGTGDLRTWFPLDWHRPARPVIFFVHLRRSSRRVGFTVSDAPRVQQILRNKHLLSPSAA